MAEGIRLLLITRYFPPLDSIATARMYTWAKYLYLRGYQVDVLTTKKTGQVLCPLDWDTSAFTVHELDYFDLFVFLGLSKSRDSTQKQKRTLSHWCRHVYRRRLNERIPSRTDPWFLSARRWLSMTKARGIHFDLIISSYGPPAAHCIAWQAKRLFGCYWLADYRDLWVENACYPGIWPFTFLEKQLERRLLRLADSITTVSEPYCDHLRKKFPHAAVHCIENGYDEKQWEEVEGNSFADHPVCFRIVYTGSLYLRNQDPGPLFSVLQELDKSSFELLFYGSSLEGLETLIESYGLSSNVRVMGYVPHRDAMRLQRSADALLFLENPKPQIEGVLTGKLFEYLASGTPILAVGIRPEQSAGQIIQKAGAGFVCGENKRCIEHAIKRLRHRNLPKRNQEFIRHFSREKEVDRLINCLPESLRCAVTCP